MVDTIAIKVSNGMYLVNCANPMENKDKKDLSREQLAAIIGEITTEI